MIDIDGSYGEGGGQILRTASCLALLTGKTIRISNVRRGRKEPGLRVQHLLGIRALARLAGGELKGDHLGSSEVEFRPGQSLLRNLQIKIETAASIVLMLHSLLPVAALAPHALTVSFDGGATDTAFSPTFGYLRHIFLWFLTRMGIKVEVQAERSGYYPRGGAIVTATIEPSRPVPLNLLERGLLKRVVIHSCAANVLRQRRVAERQAQAALQRLEFLSAPVERDIRYAPSISPGSSMCIVASYENTVVGADGLGARGKTAEAVGAQVAASLLQEISAGGCLDRHMADQILPYLAIAGGQSAVSVSEITAHCRTNIWVIEQFLDGRFEVSGNVIRWRG
jgi:RNA 3'-phosphate cyclase